MGDLSDVFKRFMSDDPYSKVINRGIVLRDGGDVKAAMECFSKAAELRPSCPVAVLYLADAHNQLDESREAIRFSDRSIELCLMDPYCELLRVPAGPGRAPGPVLVLAFAWLVRGSALGDEQCFQEAFDSSSVAVALEPYFAQAWLNRGCAAARMGRLVDALASVDTALRVSPRYDVALRVMGQLRSGTSATTQARVARLPEDVAVRAQAVADELRLGGKAVSALEDRFFDRRRARADEAWGTLKRQGGAWPLSREEALEGGVLAFQRWGQPPGNSIPIFEGVLESAEATGRQDLEGVASFCLMFVHIVTAKCDRAIYYARRAFELVGSGKIEISYTVRGRTVTPAALAYEAGDVLSHLSWASVDAANSERHRDAQSYLRAVEELRRQGP